MHTQYVGDIIPLWPPLQNAFQVWTDVDLVDVVQKHPHDTANQMCQP